MLVICATGSCRFTGWESQISLKLPRSGTRSKLQLCLLLENLKLSVRSSLLSFLTFLLTSLSYSCGLAHLAAVACPSTPLPLSCSFLTLPCFIPCREVTFTSPRVATPRGTAKSPHKQTSEAAPHKRASEEIPPFALALLPLHGP